MNMGTELIYEGFQMMIVGMGMVFIFLVVMVFCMKGMSRLLAPYSHLLAPAQQPKKQRAAEVDPAKVAAAVAAYLASKK